MGGGGCWRSSKQAAKEGRVRARPRDQTCLLLVTGPVLTFSFAFFRAARGQMNRRKDETTSKLVDDDEIGSIDALETC